MNSIAHQTGRARSGALEIHFRKLGPQNRGQSPISHSGSGGTGNRALTPILIVHGLQYFSWDWLGVAQALGGEREVACMDMRGFGDSDWSKEKDYSVPSMALDIAAVLDHLGWARAVIIGHSMGGRSTTYFCAKHAQRAAGLALIDYTPDNAPAGTKRTTELVGNTPDVFPSLEAARAYLGPKKPAVRYEHYLKDLSVKRDPYFRDQFKKVLAGGERPKLGVDMWSLLGEVRCPMLSVRGKRSDMYAPETVAKMKAANPRLEVVEVDAGHDIAGENQAALVEVLKKWIPGE